MSDGKNGVTGTSGKRTLIEEGTAVTGNMASSCPIVVMGKIEGEITGPSMEIAETGVVSGKVKVAVFASRGELAGELEAETVRLAGRVRDETVIRARSLEVVASGTALQFGECELSIGDEPDKRKAIEEATGAARKSAPAAAPAAVAAAAAPVAAAAPAAAAAAPPAPPAPAPERRRRGTGAVATPLDGPESGRVA